MIAINIYSSAVEDPWGSGVLKLTWLQFFQSFPTNYASLKSSPPSQLNLGIIKKTKIIVHSPESSSKSYLNLATPSAKLLFNTLNRIHQIHRCNTILPPSSHNPSSSPKSSTFENQQQADQHPETPAFTNHPNLTPSHTAQHYHPSQHYH